MDSGCLEMGSSEAMMCKRKPHAHIDLHCVVVIEPKACRQETITRLIAIESWGDIIVSYKSGHQRIGSRGRISYCITQSYKYSAKLCTVPKSII